MQGMVLGWRWVTFLSILVLTNEWWEQKLDIMTIHVQLDFEPKYDFVAFVKHGLSMSRGSISLRIKCWR